MTTLTKTCQNCKYRVACSLLQCEGFDWNWCCDNWELLLKPEPERISWEPMDARTLWPYLPRISLN
jgi:hypothetical protein